MRLQWLWQIIEPLDQHGVITAGLLKAKIVLSVAFWECLSSYVIHDASQLDERQESLTQMDGGLAARQQDWKDNIGYTFRVDFKC